MPTYEYECPRCPRVFEVKQRITEPALATCDRCGGPIHRLLSAAPFILKGEGWYVTDYPSESRKKAKDSTSKESTSKESASKESASKESTSKEPASKGDGASAESKPATSSESKSSTEGGSRSASPTRKPTTGSKPAAGS
ncbi:MAG TPA: FmdB family zinc ribbon protein [Methylomirabilota bacterium]